MDSGDKRKNAERKHSFFCDVYTGFFSRVLFCSDPLNEQVRMLSVCAGEWKRRKGSRRKGEGAASDLFPWPPPGLVPHTAGPAHLRAPAAPRGRQVRRHQRPPPHPRPQQPPRFRHGLALLPSMLPAFFPLAVVLPFFTCFCLTPIKTSSFHSERPFV